MGTEAVLGIATYPPSLQAASPPRAFLAVISTPNTPTVIFHNPALRVMSTTCYVRVSTEEQSLERQLQSVQSYAEEKLDTELSDLQIFRDKSTGTDTSRSGYRDMMGILEEGDVEHVVVHEISRLARSLQDLERTVSRITDNDTAIHFVRDGLSFGDGKEQPMNKLQM